MSDVDGGGEETGAYDTFIWVTRSYVQWSSFIVCGMFTVLLFWIHWGTAVDNYGAQQSDDFPSVTDDTNSEWRLVFSLRPEIFVDLFTPLVFGGFECLQHLSPQYMNATIAGTWLVRAVWFFVMSLFAQFGYGGNLGVLVGYYTDFGIVIPCLALAVLDHTCDEVTQNNFTTAKVLPLINDMLDLCGLNKLCPGLAAVQRQQSVMPKEPVVGGSA